ncbi:MAG: NAD(P)H-dependent oxidoreductase [Chromatiales bacterium]|nr:NAD(P)H-dependent oxidoreductase [Chromatiales bacterium]
MARRIVIIQGHPDPDPSHLDHALAAAYRESAEAAGHEVRVIEVGRLDFPLLRNKQDFDHGEAPPAIIDAQQHIEWAEHLLVLHPLWLGDMPALLKAFLEQVFRPGFGFEGGRRMRPRLRGRSARVVITMGMPAFIYRWYFGAHSLKLLRRHILGFCGFGPVRSTLLGLVDTSDARRQRWLERMRALGRAGA